MRKASSWIAKSLLLLSVSLVTYAQSSSGVTGIITDPTGALISGATVTLTDTKTSKELTTTSDDKGTYRFNQIPPGQGYTLSFSASGFQNLVIRNVALGVGIIETHNAELALGAVSGTVEITAANEVTLNTTDPSIGNVIDERRLRELPIQFRSSPAALIGLQPGVIGSGLGLGGGSAGTNRLGSVTGARSDQNNITVDGIDANDQATGQFAATTGNSPIDALQEFRAVTSNPGADEGRSSGGQIDLVTKSGTNEFHGNVRLYNRTAATAANSFFNNRAGIARPQLTRNQFGGSVGGPIKKDKLFFFFDYEGRRDAQGVSYLRIVPLSHFRGGSLGYINNTAGCAAGSRLNTAPQCISVLTPAQVAALDPQGIGPNTAFLSFLNGRYPAANDLTAGDGINTGGFRFNAPSKRSDNTYTTRIDWNLNERHKLFGRFNIVRSLVTDTINTVAAQFPSDPESGSISGKDRAWVVGHTFVINQSMVNQITIGESRSILAFPRPFAPASPIEYGTPTTPLGTGGTFGPFSTPFPDISVQERTVPVPTFRDDLTWTKGSHSFSLGGSFKPHHQISRLVNDFHFVTIGLGGNLGGLDASLQPANLRNDTTAFGNYDAAFAFLLGRYATLQTNFNYDPQGVAAAAGSGKNRDYRYQEYEFYFQDSWKVRPDLTVTAGMRWHYYPAPYEGNGFQAGNDVDFRQLWNVRQSNGALGISGVNAEPFLRYDLAGKENNARPFYQPDLNNFAPRLGFAYSPSFRDGFLGKLFGDRRTSLRGGGAVVYDRVSNNILFVQDQVSYLFDNSTTTNFGVTDPRTSLLTDPRFTAVNALPVNNVAPTITRPFTPFVDASGFPFGLQASAFNYAVDQQFRTPYSIQYSLGFQREIPGNFILELSYVGRQGRKLFSQADASQVVDFRDQASGQMMLDAFNQLQAQVQAGLASSQVALQPWFENQIGPGGTRLMAGNATLRRFVLRGDTADAIQLLYANNLLNPNVGLSAQFSTNVYIANQGSSSYNGMLLSLRKRFSKGMQFDFNYTWSKSIDNGSSIVNTVVGGLVCDLRNLRVCRGPSDFDIRHLVNANFIYELPFGRGRWFGSNAPGWVNAIIGGWEFTGILTARSGLPFSTTTTAFPLGYNFNSPAAFNNNNSGALVPQIHDAANGTVQFFADPSAVFNPSAPTAGAIRFPHHGEIGNRNSFRGPSFWNLDTALLKKFSMPWSENQMLQIRWESYNALNHHVYGLPNVGITSAAFGQITTSASSARVMQFAVRYEF